VATDDVLAQALEIVERRWESQDKELAMLFVSAVKRWYEMVIGMQRTHLMVTLRLHHVPIGVARFLAYHWPQRLLPRFAPEQWRAKWRGEGV